MDTYHTTNYVIRNSADMFLENGSVSTHDVSWTTLYNRAFKFAYNVTAANIAKKINEICRNENRIDPQGNPMTVRVCEMETTITIKD